LEYISQDFCQYEGKSDEKSLQIEKWNTAQIDIVSDIVAIPEKDKSFDAIMCIEVFEHIPEPIKAIKEFSRLLKKGGYLILTASFCSLTHFAPYHFYSGYNRYFYEYHLKEAGFEILEISPNGNYFSYLAQEIRRIPYCAELYASKKLSRFTSLIIKILLYILENIEKNDKNSSEFLCFGYHVLARKNKD
jgi:ubiquinone/menaquinone biosynthesis C-methylase UbiE